MINGQSKMDNPENWQLDEEKQNKIVLDTTMHKQTKAKSVNK
jgi:hypothetical protein